MFCLSEIAEFLWIYALLKRKLDLVYLKKKKSTKVFAVFKF